MHSLHRPHNRQTSKHPTKLRMCRDQSWIIDQCTLQVYSTSHVELCNSHSICPQFIRIMSLSKTMHIRQKKKKFWILFCFLQFNERSHRSKIISQMKLLPCWFKSGKNSFCHHSIKYKANFHHNKEITRSCKNFFYILIEVPGITQFCDLFPSKELDF